MLAPERVFVKKLATSGWILDILYKLNSQFKLCSVTKSCPILCNPRTDTHKAPLSFTVSWALLKSMSIESWRYLTISSSVTSFSFCLQSFPASGSFPMNWLFASGGQSIRASASGSVPPMNIQVWFLQD